MSNVNGPLCRLSFCTLPSVQLTFRDVVDIFCRRGCMFYTVRKLGAPLGSLAPPMRLEFLCHLGIGRMSLTIASRAAQAVRMGHSQASKVRDDLLTQALKIALAEAGRAREVREVSRPDRTRENGFRYVRESLSGSGRRQSQTPTGTCILNNVQPGRKKSICVLTASYSELISMQT
jgi:hypothetical protein